MPVLTDVERVGTTIGGKYRLDRIAGRGGVGTVFAGVHLWTGRDVAVKMLHPEHARDRSVVDRFLTEARAATTLRHPNVVDVLDMGQEDDGTVYMVLEFLNGESLAKRLERRKRLTADETARILLPVMDALAEAHDLAIVHRDIKPENVLIALDAKRRHVPKLLDFGIAKVLTVGAARSTRTGMVVGTPAYMSPEQAEGITELGPSSDIWSMGVMFFECLTGRLPFESASATGTLVAIMSKAAPPVRSLAPDVPEALAAAIDRALAKSPSARWPHIRSFAAAIGAALGPGVLTHEDPSGAITNGALASSDDRTVVTPPLSAAAGVTGPRAVPVTVKMEAPNAHTTPLAIAATTRPAAPPGSRVRVVLGAGVAAVALVTGLVVASMAGGPSRGAISPGAEPSVAAAPDPSVSSPLEPPATAAAEPVPGAPVVPPPVEPTWGSVPTPAPASAPTVVAPPAPETVETVAVRGSRASPPADTRIPRADEMPRDREARVADAETGPEHPEPRATSGTAPPAEFEFETEPARAPPERPASPHAAAPAAPPPARSPPVAPPPSRGANDSLILD